MFTGIIETLGTITAIQREGENVHLTIASSISDELKIDQSVAHGGICLTVVGCSPGEHTVTAIAETVERTALSQWKTGDQVNLERALVYNGRLDGHLVQGHVDTTATCIDIREADGSWYFRFRYSNNRQHILVDKGSICINGVSLTVVNPTEEEFEVAIIPYTYEHTTFNALQVKDKVNLEFDIVGKYIATWMDRYNT